MVTVNINCKVVIEEIKNYFLLNRGKSRKNIECNFYLHLDRIKSKAYVLCCFRLRLPLTLAAGTDI